MREAIAHEIKGTDYGDVMTESGKPDCEPSGYVVHTFRWVLYILLTSDSFAEVVQKAANLGGDSDTIGAIAGGLAGVYYGYDGIPKSYTEQILIKERLDRVSERITVLRTV